MKSFVIWAAGIASVVLFAATVIQPNEIGVWEFDIRWARDIIFEAQGALLGLLIFGVVNWAFIPLNWSDAKDDSLPPTVRAASPIALALVLWAILGAAGSL